MKSADLASETIKCRYTILQSILNKPLRDRLLLSLSNGKRFLHKLKVLLQNLKRIVDSAVRAESKDAINHVAKSALLADHFRLELFLTVVTNRRWVPRHIHADTDTERPARPMV